MEEISKLHRMGQYYNVKKPIESKYPSLCTDCVRKGCRRPRKKVDTELFDGSISLETVIIKKRSNRLVSVIGCTGFKERAQLSKILSISEEVMNYALSPINRVIEPIKSAMNYIVF